VVTCSAITPAGIGDIWDVVLAHRAHMEANGRLAPRRRAQSLAWMRELVATGLDAVFRADPRVAEALPALEAAVAEGRTTASAAARQLLTCFRG
jgi:LAO/AO transport system kinase